MRNTLAAILILTCVCACKKKQIQMTEEELVNMELRNGLPEDSRKINGYFFSACITNETQQQHYISAYAAFSEPAVNLLAGHRRFDCVWNHEATFGNIDLGNVNCGTTKLNKSLGNSKCSYHLPSTGSLEVPESLRWQTEGNRTFKAIECTTRNFPYFYFLSRKPDDVVKSRNYVVDVASVTYNYDSVTVAICDGPSYVPGPRKTVPRGVASITFTLEDFNEFYVHNSWGTITFCAYNYSHLVADNRVILFEQANKVSRWLTLLNQ